ncbi:MAG: lamin tail domain-containing protein, partial [Planctomycetota bacterium]
DWIEIYNSGNYTVNIGGMYLTDDLSAPTKWRIHSDGRGIPPGGYLIIWADGETSSTGLHANFKLSADGEEIALFGSDGSTLIDIVSFPEQDGDISFGRYPNGGENFRFLSSPTPAAENSGVYSGDVAAPKFSHKRGFYTAPFSVTIATETKDAVIYYTIDGSEPYNFDTSGRGRSPGGKIYNVPITINKTTCLRAKAIKPGYRPSDIKTHTYIMNASDAHRSLPVISLVGDSRTTFYEPDGVMAIVGGSYVNNGQWTASGPDSHNNPMHRGMAYERPVSFEWMKPKSQGRSPQQDTPDLQIDCGLRVHGSNYMRPRYTRSDGQWSGNSKFSLRLYFRNRYGKRRLNYPLFPFEVQEFKSIVLRGGHNDRTNPFIKDELQRRLHKDMGNVASVGTMANLFINGEYKGFFNPCEHIKDEFCKQWYKSDEDWDIMTMNGVRDGDAVSFNEMINYARNNNLANDVHYQYISERLDIPAFADYLILQLWSGNWDWPQNNWSAASERSEEGKWRFFIWDIEGGMYSDRLNTVFFDSLNSQGNANGYLYRALKVNDNFRRIFADRINKHFYNNGALSAENINSRFLELQDQMSGVITNMNTYVIDTWVPNRLDIFLASCIKEGLFTIAGPTFKINDFYQHGGHISASDTLAITSTGRFNTFYYTLDGSDPQFQGLPQQNTNDTTLVYENDDKQVFVSSRSTSDVWKDPGVFNDSRWLASVGGPGGVGYDINSNYSHLVTLDLEEQMYDKNAACFIRIPFTLAARQSGYDSMVLKIRYDDGFIAYLNGVEVARRNFLGTPTVSSTANQDRPNTEAFNFEYIDISDFLSELQTGDNLLAIQGLNSSISSSEFLISAELVASKSISSPDDEDNSDITTGVLLYDGSITLTHSSQVKARILNGRSWSAMTEATFAIGPLTGNLRITEIMYNPYNPNTEYVELKNIGAETVNLNLVKFTNGIDFTFPNMELAPNEYVVVVQDREAFETRYGQRINIAGEYSGKLNDGGERIRLEDAIGQIILDFDYKDGWHSITDGDGFSLTVIDPVNTDPYGWNEKDSWRASAYLSGSPGEDDDGIIPNPGEVVINEVLAHSHADAADWIELHNTTGTAIDIGGWFLSDSSSDLGKYRIAAGTIIAPDGYIVFYEDQYFNNIAAPGAYQPFALSENGERLYLSSAEGSLLTGYRQVEDFGGSETGVSFGRY